MIAVDALLDTIARRLDESDGPLVVALDGRSGAGKSTLARRIATHFGASIVPADDFFAATIPDREWDALSPAERVRDALDWRRLRTDAMEPLRAGNSARWYAFDFARGLLGDGRYAMRREPTIVLPGPLVVLEGAYCTRRELADLLDLTVLVEAAEPIRRRRLAAREDAAFLAGWHARWDAAETFYFQTLRPPGAFDFRVAGE